MAAHAIKICLILLISCAFGEDSNHSILVANFPDPSSSLSTPQPTSADTTHPPSTTRAEQLMIEPNTGDRLYSLHSIIMLLILGCSGGILLSICCAVFLLMSCQNKNSESIRIFRNDVNTKQCIQRKEMSADLKKLSPQLSPSEMSLDFKLPPQQTHLVNGPETLCSIKVECQTPNEANMGFDDYRDYVDFVNEGIPKEACFEYPIATPGGSTSYGSDVIIVSDEDAI